MKVHDTDLWSRHLSAWIRRDKDSGEEQQMRPSALLLQSPHEGSPWFQEAFVLMDSPSVPRSGI